MMNRHSSYRAAVAAVGLLACAPWSSSVRAETRRSGAEPWYQTTADIRSAKNMFAQAVDKHRQFLLPAAEDFYEKALVLWDNPDIHWNLALLLKNRGRPLLSYQQLEHTLRWGEALGAERLGQVRDQMRELEAKSLSRIEASSDEPGAEITLDGKHWFRGPGHQVTFVEPGEHYVSSLKPGFFPLVRSIAATAGQQERVALPMDEDRLVETRRWAAWKPWALASAGAVVAAIGAGLEFQVRHHQRSAVRALPGVCDMPDGCTPTEAAPVYDRAVVERRIAIGAFVAGGAAAAVGLTMAWLNQVHIHRTEARKPAPIQITPILSTEQAGMSAQLRF